jgi:hypothetical protein
VEPGADNRAALVFSPDGKWLAGNAPDGKVLLWSSTTGRIERMFAGHAGQTAALAFTADGKRLATGGSDRMIRIWDAAAGNETIKWSGPLEAPIRVAFDPDGRRLTVATNRGEALVYALGLDEWRSETALRISIQELPMIGEITTLHAAFKLAVDQIMVDMRARGWDPVIGSGMRTNEEQDALYAQGRKPLKTVNSLRSGVGFAPIRAADNAKPVTKARGGKSNHNKRHSYLPHGSDALDVVVGYAVDIVDRKRGWQAQPGFWKDLGLLAAKYGCEWGGNWKDPDPAHVEMKLIDSAPRTSIVV